MYYSRKATKSSLAIPIAVSRQKDNPQMQNNYNPPAHKAPPTFVGFDNVNGQAVATFAIGNTKRDIPYSEARKFAITTQAALVPEWFIAGGK